MADCWAERMVLPMVDLRAAQMVVKTAQKTAVKKAVNWVAWMVG